MPKPRVYVETTIPSAYYTDRSDPESARNRADTHRWWMHALNSCNLLTSQAVLDELGRGKSRHVPWRLWMLEGLPLLVPQDDIYATADVYINRKAMPADPLGDALHLALASHYKCDVLVTWNYRHLANGNKLNHIRRINEHLGLFVPRICTPRKLLEDDR
jgi:predicted nucleic acid-binding protein